MAKYPRFIFSNPKNSRSEGPFIVSTKPPIIIAKALWADNALNFDMRYGNAAVLLLGLPHKMDEATGQQWGERVKETLHEMAKWLQVQIELGEIALD